MRTVSDSVTRRSVAQCCASSRFLSLSRSLVLSSEQSSWVLLRFLTANYDAGRQHLYRYTEWAHFNCGSFLNNPMDCTEPSTPQWSMVYGTSSTEHVVSCHSPDSHLMKRLVRRGQASSFTTTLVTLPPPRSRSVRGFISTALVPFACPLCAVVLCCMLFAC